MTPTTPCVDCIKVGQIRAVVVLMVVINAPYYSKIEPQKVSYNHQPPILLCVSISGGVGDSSEDMVKASVMGR
jgi:hypothetical protein